MLDIDGYVVEPHCLCPEVALDTDSEPLEGNQPVVRDLLLLVEDHLDQLDDVVCRHRIDPRANLDELDLQQPTQVVK